MNFKIFVYKNIDDYVREIQENFTEKTFLIKENKKKQSHRVLGNKSNCFHTSLNSYKLDLRGRAIENVILYDLENYSKEFITQLCVDLLPSRLPNLLKINMIDSRNSFFYDKEYYEKLGIDVEFKEESLFINNLKIFLRNENNNSNCE